MAKNLFVEYVDICRKNAHKYLKAIFKKDYDEEIAQAYVECYINSRYYNLSYKETNRVFYLRIKEALLKMMEQLLKDNEKEKSRTGDYVNYRRRERIIKNMFTFFDYMFFFDKVRDIENMKKVGSIDEIVDKLYETREKLYGINERKDTKGEFLKLVKSNMVEAEMFLDKYFIDNTFELSIKKVIDKPNLYNIELVSNLRMPMIYSSAAINVAFNSEIIREERLLPEYALLSLIIARDIVEANFRDEYLVEFAATATKKKNKLTRITSLINDPAIQEKLNLRITYEAFKKYQNEIFDLMKEGYKFALELDRTFKDIEEIKKLKMFSYFIVKKDLKQFKQIFKRYKKTDKIIYE